MKPGFPKGKPFGRIIRAEPLICFREDDAPAARFPGEDAVTGLFGSVERDAANRHVELFFHLRFVGGVFVPMAESKAASFFGGEELFERIKAVDPDGMPFAEFGRFGEKTVLDFLEKNGDFC